jgi:threonine dehydratase
VIEPSAAVAVAALRQVGAGRVGVILSGGNVDPTGFAASSPQEGRSAANPVARGGWHDGTTRR